MGPMEDYSSAYVRAVKRNRRTATTCSLEAGVGHRGNKILPASRAVGVVEHSCEKSSGRTLHIDL